jgi:hypothetical protein
LEYQKVIVPVRGFEEVTVAVGEMEPPCGTLLLGMVMTMLVGTCVVPPPPDEVEPPPQPRAAMITEHAPRVTAKR